MPFVAAADTPIVFVEPDEVKEFSLRLPQYCPHTEITIENELEERLAYSQSFSKSKQLLVDGLLNKIVLSRRMHVKSTQTWNTEELFLRACQNRPNSFVSLWSTPQTGMWLVATPEPLLQKDDRCYKTVALAGTLPYDRECVPIWNAKNKNEQAVVAQFIEEQIKEVCQDMKHSQCHTLHFGNIQHLCTDFTFTLKANSDLRMFLKQLHPTPAVCGLPRHKALTAILENETGNRKYYAGFSGPLNLKNETNLFVSLRCAELFSQSAVLYAGGGIMPESIENEEWEETCRKLQTMLNVLKGKT